MPGVFDKQGKPEGLTLKPEDKPTTVTKTDFQSPQAMAKNQAVSTAQKTSDRNLEDPNQNKVDKINQMMGGGQSEQDRIEEEFNEMNKISEDDLKLAEQLIFQGYAEKIYQIPRFPNQQFTICSLTADEINMVEELLYNLIQSNKSDKEEDDISESMSDVSEIYIGRMRSAYTMALGYKGNNGKDICEDRVCQLDIIKKAMIKLSEYEAEGKIKEFTELKNSIKQSIKKRSVAVKRLPTPIVDMISNSRYEFEQMLYKIMNAKGIYPKS